MNESPKRVGGPSPKPGKAYSCIRCFERKVKCDKNSPCGNCQKSSVECIFRVPPAPKRRKKRTQEEILKAKLTQYEGLLRAKGIDIHKDGIKLEDLPDANPETEQSVPDSDLPAENDYRAMRASGGMMPSRSFIKPTLIVEKGKTRFVENNLWTSMAEEFRKPSDAMGESSSEDEDDDGNDEDIDFVLGGTPSSPGVRDLHPLPEQIFPLWQIFLDNVNPLSKLVHAPTLQPAIIEASSHLDKLPRSLEALLFAIYSLAVLSLDHDQCETMLGESKSVLLSRFRLGTKRALSRAKFLGTMELMVLQAFILHLLCMREIYDPKTLWTLTGVGNRISEGMGVHRDGSTLGLGPFETELRRRAWWQLVFLDFRTAELSGSGNYGNMGLWDVRLPCNINDEDIWPGMTEEPVSKNEATEMIFCLTRYELGHFWKTKLLTKDPSGNFTTLWDNFRKMSSIEEKEQGIKELEQTLEHKYVRFCDPSSPVEFIAILIMRGATNGMRLMSHHPRTYAKDEDVPESERRLLWSLANKLLDMDILIYSSPTMARFRWHAAYYFQWHALIYVLGELKRLPLHEQADRGWQVVHQIYENHPGFVTEIKKPMHLAVGSLCAKAWKARKETWLQREVPTPMVTPAYIEQLIKDREEKKVVQTPMQVKPQQDYFGQITPQISAAGQPTIRASSDGAFMMDSTQPKVNLPMQTHGMNSQQMQFQQSLPQEPPLPPLLQFTEPVAQPTNQLYWWDVSANGMNPQMDFSFDQLAGIGQESMDWSQWDFLMKGMRPSG